MIIQAITTRPITEHDKNLHKILDEYLTTFPDGSILAVTSKIVAICEGRTVKIDGTDKQKLIAGEADRYLPLSTSQYHISLSIKDASLIANAGIDESNGNGHYILWPKNAQSTANDLRVYLKKRFKINHCGVIITDSITIPLRWGVIGMALAHSGFTALADYRGAADVFGRKLEMAQGSISGGLAASAVLAMGEGSEQTPLAVISELPKTVQFQDRNPKNKELKALKIDAKDDLYAPLLGGVKWHKK